jgi:ATP-binding cassette subfamily F protein 3
LREAVKQAEAEIARLSGELREIDRTLLAPARNGAGSLLKTRAEIERKLAAAESRWLAASEALEQAEGA